MSKQLTLEIAQKFLQDGTGDLDTFTSIDDAAAQALAKHEGNLSLDGLTSLSDAALQALAQHKGSLYLNGLTSLSDAALQALAQHKGGTLSLNGLTSLSDAALQALAQHKGGLSLDGLTSLSDAAAQALAQHKRGGLSLKGLTSLSDAAVQALAQHKRGGLSLKGLTSLSDAAVQALAQHEGNLWLDGLTSLSDAAVQALAQHKGRYLSLDGLTSLSEAAAQALAQHKQRLSLNGLTSLSDAAAKALAQHEGDLFLGKVESKVARFSMEEQLITYGVFGSNFTNIWDDNFLESKELTEEKIDEFDDEQRDEIGKENDQFVLNVLSDLIESNRSEIGIIGDIVNVRIESFVGYIFKAQKTLEESDEYFIKMSESYNDLKVFDFTNNLYQGYDCGDYDTGSLSHDKDEDYYNYVQSTLNELLELNQEKVNAMLK